VTLTTPDKQSNGRRIEVVTTARQAIEVKQIQTSKDVVLAEKLIKSDKNTV